jgi:hypothetical protein
MACEAVAIAAIAAGSAPSPASSAQAPKYWREETRNPDAAMEEFIDKSLTVSF